MQQFALRLHRTKTQYWLFDINIVTNHLNTQLYPDRV
jgi:hypothetical protein